MMWSCVGLLVDLSAGLLNKSLIKYRAVFTNNCAPRTETLTLDNCLAKAVGVNERVNIRIVWVVCYVELFLYRPAIISRRSDLSDYLPSFFVCHCDGSCRPGCSSSDLAMLADTHTLRDVSLYSSRTLCMCLSACKVQREPINRTVSNTNWNRVFRTQWRTLSGMLWNFCDFGAVSCVKTYFLTCLPRKINWNSSKFKSTQVHWRYTKQKRACQGGSCSLPTVIVRPVSVKLFWSLVRWASWIVKCVGRIFRKYYYVLVYERPSGQMSLKNRAMLAVDSWSAESADNQASCALSRITSTRCAKI